MTNFENALTQAFEEMFAAGVSPTEFQSELAGMMASIEKMSRQVSDEVKARNTKVKAARDAILAAIPPYFKLVFEIDLSDSDMAELENILIEAENEMLAAKKNILKMDKNASSKNFLAEEEKDPLLNFVKSLK